MTNESSREALFSCGCVTISICCRDRYRKSDLQPGPDSRQRKARQSSQQTLSMLLLGFVSCERNEHDSVCPPSQVLIGLEATSRSGENLSHFLEQSGYHLCLLHPQQTHQFSRALGTSCQNRSVGCYHDCTNAIARGGSSRIGSYGVDCKLSGMSAIT